MRCPYPISIPNPAIKQNVIVEYRQDGTLLTSLGEILEPRTEVPCGHCMVCLENRREDWATRMECESRTAAQTLFVTLTYSPEFCPDELKLLDLQKFCRRMRDKFGARYFACGEYGGKFGRPHYHAIVWLPNYHDEDDSRALVSSCWSFGFVMVREADRNAFRYVAKYTCKSVLDIPEGKQPPFATMSRRPGVGFSYFNQIQDFEHEYILLANGQRRSLPRYFLDKLDPVEKISIKRTKRTVAESMPQLSQHMQVVKEQHFERRLKRRYIEKYGKY